MARTYRNWLVLFLLIIDPGVENCHFMVRVLEAATRHSRHSWHSEQTTELTVLMSTKIVGDGLIEQAILYQPVFWLFRLDVLPFLLSYGLFFACALSKNLSVTYTGLIALPILFALHLFLFLMAQWSVKVRCVLGYKVVNDIKAAQVVRVMAAQNAGADRLSRLAANPYFSETVSVNILGRSYSITKERLEFQKVTYNFDADRNNFVRLEYPTSVPMKTVLDWRGHTSTQSVGLSLMRWGTNEYDIPIPNFLDLYLVRVEASC